MSRIKKILPVPACLLIGLVALQACATPGGHPSGAEQKFDEAHALYLRGSYENAIDRFTDILRSREGRAENAVVARAYLFRGECREARQQYGLARFDYDMAMKVAKSADPPFSGSRQLISECSMRTGDTFMLEGAYLKADQSFEAHLDENPPVEYRDSMLFRRYLCSVKLGRPDPEQHIRQVSNRRNFDEKALRKKFLGGGSRTPLSASSYRSSPPVQSIPVPEIVIWPRSEWNARPVKSNISLMTKIQKITLHHSGEASVEMRREECAARIRAYQKVHQDPPRDWADLGYHYVMDRAGRIWEGRPIKYQGAHAGNAILNRGNIGVSLLGNYSEQMLTGAQKENLAEFLALLCNQYGISPSSGILTHNEIRPGYTECPGRHLQQFVDNYRAIHR
jgi:tetratricopeptide (TPR) repeat protein